MSPKPATSALGLGFAVAATAALAQLGLAYGFGLLSWADAAPGSADPVLDYRWNANLAWVVWFSAASCVVGGMASGVIGSRGAASGSSAVRVGAVFAAAVGAFAIGPLVALSAQQSAASSSFPTDPLLAAGVGAAVGFVLTLIGLGSRAVAVNVGASVALIWLLAVLATFTDIGDPATPVTELAVWGSWASPDSALGRRGLSIAVPFVIGSALIGIVVAAIARRGPITNSGYRIAAASGIAGPLIVTVAHLADPSQADNPVILVGPYAAIAGLLGSLIVSAIPRAGGQVDDAPETSEATDRIEPAPGWTVPEAPGSAYSGTKAGDTKDLPAEDAPADPDVDWVQELKPVGEGGTLTADADTKTEAKAKPKRTRKAAKRTRRKLADTESDAEKEES
ncbi:hypothetical protein [Glycomyces arizonensis]|uniref:hypothetical protein n=1 Tax=Glycomyces arizonensis TaxID=256035 RepID=UPI000407B08C|nr:hypothetical protein [Glycomyces arizonensis]